MGLGDEDRSNEFGGTLSQSFHDHQRVRTLPTIGITELDGLKPLPTGSLTDQTLVRGLLEPCASNDQVAWQVVVLWVQHLKEIPVLKYGRSQVIDYQCSSLYDGRVPCQFQMDLTDLKDRRRCEGYWSHLAIRPGDDPLAFFISANVLEQQEAASGTHCCRASPHSRCHKCRIPEVV